MRLTVNLLAAAFAFALSTSAQAGSWMTNFQAMTKTKDQQKTCDWAREKAVKSIGKVKNASVSRLEACRCETKGGGTTFVTECTVDAWYEADRPVGAHEKE